jgi:natural product biosynthesis luciferase-like monooxygenase protein
LLLYPAGIEFIAAFFGCLYAGVIAVPAYPPRHNQKLLRLETIVADAQAAFVLTTGAELAAIQDRLGQSRELGTLQWLATDHLSIDLASGWQPSVIHSDTLALLQYTSGSTGKPKGVMVSHGNILHNQQLIQRGFGHTEKTIFAGWLPLFHDMGLIGNVLQPLYLGIPCVFMPPVAFLQKPICWLQAISRYKATTSGGPNFAYDLCVKKIKPEQKATLDLSSWEIAFNGAEPIRSQTLERFAAYFADCGFRWQAFYPCYGMAETTLFVSGGLKTASPVLYPVDSRTIVGCGRTFFDKMAIVDPASKVRCAEGQVGEIWLAGPSVAQGYWNQPDQTDQVFNAHLADSGEGPFLRTGDLGFYHQEELFVTGRLKDLIIIRGRNHYPQDIELTVEQSHLALRPGCGAALSVESDGEERLVVVQEVERHYLRHLEVESVVESIRSAVSTQHELKVYAVLLLKTGRIPKTSSGKIQRHACKMGFLNGSLEIVGSSILEDSSCLERDNLESNDCYSRAALLAKEPDDRQQYLSTYLQKQVAQVLKIAPAQFNLDQPLSTLGIDSLMAIELQTHLETSFGIALSMVRFLQDSSITQLVAELLFQLTAPEQCLDDHFPISAVDTETIQTGLSYGQRALWFLQQMDQGSDHSPNYTIIRAVRIQAELDISVLQCAVQALVTRHAALRTAFTATNGQPTAYVYEDVAAYFQHEDATLWSEAFLSDRLEQEAQQSFNLEQAPLMRVKVFTQAPQSHILVLAVHHIIVDFWSLTILIQELGRLYQAQKDGMPAQLPPLTRHYHDYVRSSVTMLASSDGDRLWAYWQQQLAGASPVLNLPTDRPRPPVQTFQGGSIPFQISGELTQQLKAVSRDHGATLYMTLLAVFQVLLYRYTGQEDLLVGSPMAGRSQADWANLVGYFMNPVVLRADLSHNPPFTAFLASVRSTVLGALQHQDYPFASLVERLKPVRDSSRSPLFQVMFILHKAHLLHEEGLTAFALGEMAGRLHLGDWDLECLPLKQRVSHFDLTLMMAEVDGKLTASLEYNTNLFDGATIERMAGHFQTLLQTVVANPHQPVAELQLLTEHEQQQLLVDWNATQTDYPWGHCIHLLFEQQVERTPDAIAVVFEDQQLTYQELNDRANQLAHHLQALGVEPEVLVGLCGERSLDMVVGLLGILKAGGAYVPLDPTYPQERLALVLSDAQVAVLLTQQHLLPKLPPNAAKIRCLDTDWDSIALESQKNLESAVTSDNLAYVLYTSGSTGRPKGVMVRHRNVINFFTGMDSYLGGDSPGVWLAVTSISFDISVLELFWTLTRGFRVVIQREYGAARSTSESSNARSDREFSTIESKQTIDFSLFYFASDDQGSAAASYKLLLEGAKFADQHGFSAIWTPERHFHEFGGSYPNPSVTSAAIATITERIQIRAGSVVLPLHNPIRVAEEWAVVDNLSQGRVGISFASGWNGDDFVLAPDNYGDRKRIMQEGIETVQQLWRGDSIICRGGSGNDVEVKIRPRPVQPELPTWLTAAGNPETFRLAGEMGVNLLTHLLGQNLEELAANITLYRQAYQAHHPHRAVGHVTLMLHTFVGQNIDTVRQVVHKPFCNYLLSSIGLLKNLASSLGQNMDVAEFTAEERQILLDHAFDRYFSTSGLFGTVSTCLPMVERLKAIGVNEVACLIDFGVEFEAVMSSLHELANLKQLSNPNRNIDRFDNPDAGNRDCLDYSLGSQIQRHSVTHLQCTPALARLLTMNPETFRALSSLQKMMIGGEALPLSLVQQLRQQVAGNIYNLYGPTETTIWSTVYAVDSGELADKVALLGKPIANTEIYILDRHHQLVPIGVPGELVIGGAGVARGYLNLPDLTTERFIANPFSPDPEQRLYKTGDLVRYLNDGTIEFLGRLDHQIKLRGFRIELGEIESVLLQHPHVREVVVVARKDANGSQQLIAYIVLHQDPPIPNSLPRILLRFLEEKLPDYMLPAAFVILPVLPLTPNGKVDRHALPEWKTARTDLEANFVAPRTAVEETLANVWADILGLKQVGIYDNFFDLGGHSLLIVQVHHQIREIFNSPISVVDLYRYPTINALAQEIGYDSESVKDSSTVGQAQERANKRRQASYQQHKQVMKRRKQRHE